MSLLQDIQRRDPEQEGLRGRRFFRFRGHRPQAPVHILIIPKKHIPTLNDITEADGPMMGRLMVLASKIARERGLDAKGFRLLANCLEPAGQSVFHLYFHLMGGRVFRWPPG